MFYDLQKCLVMFRVCLECISMFCERYLMSKCLAMFEGCFFYVLELLGMFYNVLRVCLSDVY